MSKTTITVDAQLLQLLNDRICQTLDALNQVRWSSVANQQHNVYGIPAQNIGSSWYGATPSQSYVPFQAHTGINPFGRQTFAPLAPTVFPQSHLGYTPQFSRTDIPVNGAAYYSGINNIPSYSAPVSMGF